MEGRRARKPIGPRIIISHDGMQPHADNP